MTDTATFLPGNRLKSLAELNPMIGEKVRLEVGTPRQRFTVQLIGLKKNQSLLVTRPKLTSPGLLHAGTRFTARLMSGNYLCSFETRLLQVQSQPFPYWHLAYPKQVELRRVRQHTRVAVNLAVRIEADECALPGSGAAITACCRDLSLSGARIDAARALGQPGDALFVTARVSVAGMDQMLLLPARICSQQQSAAGLLAAFSHGVEFIDLEEETRLVLAGFIYQQQLLNSGYLEEVER
ncbi:MAG: flagellar brake protein [Pseudomonadota bacterium]|jgi:c-di-GMP-binding flagellar brake protein YcgR|nr:flagellar brake protein [Pseudomonadota bacterium]